MANSVLTQIKVKEEKTQETAPRQWEIKKEPEDRNAVTFTHTFESKDQAIAVHRMLGHQVQQLKAQAAEGSQSHLPYLADVLEDYACLLQTMQEKIENSVNR